MAKTIRKSFEAVETKEGDEDRSLIVTISTMNPDRSHDVVDPGGADIEAYLRNPVVALNHNYQGLPIAKTEQLEINDDRIMAKVRFPDRGVYPLADTVYDLYKGGFMNAWSIGFIPKSATPNDQGGKDFTQWELLEYSAVLVPDNPEALTMLRSKGFDVDEKGVVKSIESVKTVADETVKSVVPFKAHPLAEEGTAWDGAKEIASATPEQLKEMATWFDSENPDVKSSYKLPHHRASDLYTVWMGVSAAMGALMGARGGVDLPESDREGVYAHLSKHYAEFEKDAPEMRAYSESELKELFPDEIKEEIQDMTEPRYVVDTKTRKMMADVIVNLKDLVSNLEMLVMAEKAVETDEKTKMVIDLVQGLKMADRTIGLALKNYKSTKS